MVVKYSWGERFINWLINSKTLRQKMGKQERLMTCIQLDRMVFDDVSPFLETLRSEATKEGYDAAIADVVALLRSSRTLGGETITSAKHAADVIARGDARGAAKKEPHHA